MPSEKLSDGIGRFLFECKFATKKPPQMNTEATFC